MHVADSIELLRQENAQLREELSTLRAENAKLKANTQTTFETPSCQEERYAFLKALVLLEEVYGDLIHTTKQQMLIDIRREMDEASQTLLTKHERIREEVLSIQKQSQELQESLKHAENKQMTGEMNRSMSMHKQTQGTPLPVRSDVPPLEYYLRRGECQLKETSRSMPDTPHFFKSAVRNRPVSVMKPRIDVHREVRMHRRPLTGSVMRRDLMQRKIGSVVHQNPLGQRQIQDDNSTAHFRR